MDVSIPAVKARGSAQYSPETAWELGFSGNGINVAVIDAGVDDEHPDLAGKFVAGVDFTQDESILAPRDGSYNPDDQFSHGTFCAGLIMATGADSSGDYIGGAPDAGLIDIKMHTGQEPGTNIDIQTRDWDMRLIESFNWTIVHKDDFNIRVISVSKGGGPSNSDGTDPVSIAANDAVKSGIVVVAGAGNDGPDNEGSYGLMMADEVITVGAIDDMESVTRDDDIIADFSSRGPRANDGDKDLYDELKPDITAPGVDIMSLDSSFTALPAFGYRGPSSGTSFSTPITAGIVALMLEANADLIPSDVKDILHKTAEPRGEPDYPQYPFPHNKWNRSYGYGIVDAYEAVKMALDYKPTQPGTNNPPVITLLSASPKVVKPNGQSTISTYAYDPEGDFINYEYSVSGGTITGYGSEVTWTAPENTGSYEITVVANDGKLSSIPETVTISVEGEIENHAPEISSVDITPNPVPIDGTVQIEVSAYDPDGDTLRYEYNIDGGTLSGGSGPMVSWTAPPEEDIFTLQVKVFDIKNAEAEWYEDIFVEYENYWPEILGTTVEPAKVPNDGTGEVLIQVPIMDQNGLYDIKSVTVDLTEVGGSSSGKLNDRGRQGDSVEGDGTYSLLVEIPSSVSAGEKTIIVTVSDQYNAVTITSISIEVLGAEAKGEEKDNFLPGFDGITVIIVLLALLSYSRFKRGQSS